MMYVRPMDGSEISKNLGISRQYVSSVLKKAMRKFYTGVKRIDPMLGPFDISCIMMKMLNIANNESEIRKFYNLFPIDVRKEIELDALENHVSNKLKEDYIGG